MKRFNTSLALAALCLLTACAPGVKRAAPHGAVSVITGEAEIICSTGRRTSFKFFDRTINPEIALSRAVETGDLAFFDDEILLRPGVAAQDMGAAALEQLRFAPETGYSEAVAYAIPNHCYAVRLTDGTYALIEFVSKTHSGLVYYYRFKYKYQPDGSRQM